MLSRGLLAAALVLGACASPELAVAPATAVPSATARPTPALTRVVRFAVLGLDRSSPGPPSLVADIPTAWPADLEGRSMNRVMSQLLAVGNGDLRGLATVPGNGDLDPLQLPHDRVVVEVQHVCRIVCPGPPEETSFPFDWAAATAPSAEREAALAAAGVHERVLRVRYFSTPLTIVARWGDAAPAADVAAIGRIVASIRADPPPPTSGEYRGWAAAGPLSDLPVGTVRLVPLPPGAVIRMPGQLFDNAPFYLVRGRQNLYAFSVRPLNDQRCIATYEPSDDRFHCTVDGRQLSWTRFGHYLGSEPASDLSQHQVIVRDGTRVGLLPRLVPRAAGGPR